MKNINSTFGKLGGNPADRLALARIRVSTVIAACERLGVIVTVEQKPLLPLAMRNYETVVSVRLARE